MAAPPRFKKPPDSAGRTQSAARADAPHPNSRPERDNMSESTATASFNAEHPQREPHQPTYRPLHFGVTRAVLTEAAQGVRYVKAEQSLSPCAQRLTDRLVHWAQTAPERTFMAQRVKNADGSKGDWRIISYGEALASARSIGQALLDRGLSAERPVVILSENDLEHALLALGCLFAGVPYCPSSPAYCTISQDFAKMRHVLDTLTPGLVLASDATRYGRALLATLDEGVEIVITTTTSAVTGRATTAFADLLATAATPAVDATMQATGAPRRLPNSSSPAARPSCPRPSSTPTACGAPTSSKCASRSRC